MESEGHEEKYRAVIDGETQDEPVGQRWGKVESALLRRRRIHSPTAPNPASIDCSAYRRFMTARANKPSSIGWSPSSSPYSTTLASDIGEDDRRRMPRAKCGKRYKAGSSGSWMRISEIFS